MQTDHFFGCVQFSCVLFPDAKTTWVAVALIDQTRWTDLAADRLRLYSLVETNVHKAQGNEDQRIAQFSNCGGKPRELAVGKCVTDELGLYKASEIC